MVRVEHVEVFDMLLVHRDALASSCLVPYPVGMGDDVLHMASIVAFLQSATLKRHMVDFNDIAQQVIVDMQCETAVSCDILCNEFEDIVRRVTLLVQHLARQSVTKPVALDELDVTRQTQLGRAACGGYSRQVLRVEVVPAPRLKIQPLVVGRVEAWCRLFYLLDVHLRFLRFERPVAGFSSLG